tara:strand:+ start:374 stop:661 length:288 start_codon:yes stop_codon:yes gene_type:complete
MSEVKTWKEVSSIHEAVKARIQEIREERNKLIQATDYYMLTDIAENLEVGQMEKLKTYRQELRDIMGVILSAEVPTLDIFAPNFLENKIPRVDID